MLMLALTFIGKCILWLVLLVVFVICAHYFPDLWNMVRASFGAGPADPFTTIVFAFSGGMAGVIVFGSR
ncbi:MAG TPA: hypothetical protein VEB18_01410 [Candidatus Paceibacterota bacterium]|nr:hypothetical protein [Candidatus Paceibacterota bacterium]